MTARPIPRRHWRSYGTQPLPTPAEALDEPFRAFPSRFMRVTCDRCGRKETVRRTVTMVIRSRSSSSHECLLQLTHAPEQERRQHANAEPDSQTKHDPRQDYREAPPITFNLPRRAQRIVTALLRRIRAPAAGQCGGSC